MRADGARHAPPKAERFCGQARDWQSDRGAGHRSYCGDKQGRPRRAAQPRQRQGPKSGHHDWERRHQPGRGGVRRGTPDDDRCIRPPAMPARNVCSSPRHAPTRASTVGTGAGSGRTAAKSGSVASDPAPASGGFSIHTSAQRRRISPSPCGRGRGGRRSSNIRAVSPLPRPPPARGGGDSSPDGICFRDV